MRKINWHKSQNHTIVIVAASLEAYLKDWCNIHSIELIATYLEVNNGKLTGKLGSRNCYGIEKVHCICEKYDLNNFNSIYVYGDSRGDKEMLAIAHEKYYR